MKVAVQKHHLWAKLCTEVLTLLKNRVYVILRQKIPILFVTQYNTVE